MFPHGPTRPMYASRKVEHFAVRSRNAVGGDSNRQALAGADQHPGHWLGFPNAGREAFASRDRDRLGAAGVTSICAGRLAGIASLGHISTDGHKVAFFPIPVARTVWRADGAGPVFLPSAHFEERWRGT